MLRFRPFLLFLAGCSPAAPSSSTSPVTIPMAAPSPSASSVPAPAASATAASPPTQPSSMPATTRGAGTQWAVYLNSMHQQLHPVFTDRLLGSLDALPPDNPLSNPDLRADVEIVIGESGALVRVAIIRLSGVSAFDVAVLDSVKRASPFRITPEALRSADGNTYVSWEFFRDPKRGCSTIGAVPRHLR